MYNALLIIALFAAENSEESEHPQTPRRRPLKEVHFTNSPPGVLAITPKSPNYGLNSKAERAVNYFEEAGCLRRLEQKAESMHAYLSSIDDTLANVAKKAMLDFEAEKETMKTEVEKMKLLLESIHDADSSTKLTAEYYANFCNVLDWQERNQTMGERYLQKLHMHLWLLHKLSAIKQRFANIFDRESGQDLKITFDAMVLRAHSAISEAEYNQIRQIYLPHFSNLCEHRAASVDVVSWTNEGLPNNFGRQTQNDENTHPEGRVYFNSL